MTERSKLVGVRNSISLPVTSPEIMNKRLGPEITKGNIAKIYEVRGTDSQQARIFKIIHENLFKNGDEIRISEIASGIGIAPKFHQAFLCESRDENYIVIEMDNAGKSLGKLMEDLADENISNKRNEIEQKISTEHETKIEKKLDEEETTTHNNDQAHVVSHTMSEKELMKQKHLELIKQLMKNDPVKITIIPQKETASTATAVEKLFGNQETFYYSLFSKIQQLAKHNISWGDSHVGNIIPVFSKEETSTSCNNTNNSKKRTREDAPKCEDMLLIDFDLAELCKDEQSALKISMNSLYNKLHLNDFRHLPNLSEKSKQLIQTLSNLETF